VTYRPPGASEGKDDITSLHLLRPEQGDIDGEELRLISGTADGALELQDLPLSLDPDIDGGVEDSTGRTFKTEGLPVRSTSILQRPLQHSLLAANLGETRICLYSLDDPVNSDGSPISQLDIAASQNGHRAYRTWSANFVSPSHLAVGLGPSEDPIHIYNIHPSGIDKQVLRTFSLQNDLDRLEGEITLSNFAKKSTSSVYPIVPLPQSSSSGVSNAETPIFLSGAYDGIIRLHDLRSDRHVEQAYIDPTDDSAIYSLLPRGREKLVVGTSRHSLLKVFDMRMGAKCYSYRDGTNMHSQSGKEERSDDWNLFLKPHSATYPGRGGGNNWARRSAESSIYSLTSPSSSSPFVYAGVENAVVELAFTNLSDPKPDPAFFDPISSSRGMKSARRSESGEFADVLNLAMYEQSAVRMDLMSQRSVDQTKMLVEERQQQLNRGIYCEERWRRHLGHCFVEGLDERWRVGT
jgi:WD40 repeat protein